MHQSKHLIFVIFIFVSLVTLARGNDTYHIDKSHASIGFSVAHLVISKVRGTFNDFKGSLEFDDKGNFVKAKATIHVRSIDTGSENRDKHLRGQDFFDIKKHPDIIFESKKAIKRGKKHFLIGKLTIHGITKNIELPYEIKGPIVDPWGNKKIGFEAKTTINRYDFGLGWNKALETGGVVVGETVDIIIDLEATKK